MLARFRSWLFWRRFQRSTAKALSEARARHACTREIRARQRATVNAALRAGR